MTFDITTPEGAILFLRAMALQAPAENVGKGYELAESIEMATMTIRQNLKPEEPKK